ncbi:aldehyde dehydrogenase (NADP(+)) [Chelativorans intermedius]|uniref:Aldehyde dehydrogenase (NADP(+)) n=1 Tax=Chelativorans intermedius TaxID=515947 RepID=A0ABV6D925_9HYPH|nr:aldehyde dehydrogenase (NADP(+)) [Chelativorans intermedius]MCT8998704.1 aldehyde dehydrogenase (NADP(+)) [Chelativorans intermedius]
MSHDFKPHGKHLIAGAWVASESTFSSDPVTGPAHQFSVGTAAEVDRAAQAAEEAFWAYGYSSRESRAAFLNAIADEIEARAETIADIATRETGLPEARINAERGRTTGQLRLFARHIEKGAYLDRRHDPADPQRQPLPKPDLKLMQLPVGPVGVFGASNFPLAFSTAGGDTASALAAGCPVIVKGHQAHPGTGEIVAEAILAAIEKTGQHPGVFSLIQSNLREAGEALVTHPLVKAVGFTGSLGGGRALFNLAAGRPEPIPFYGELGSVNPVFLLPAALAARAAKIGEGWAASLTMGVGQFCTNPGVAVALDGPNVDAFLEAAQAALEKVAEQPMLTAGIAEAYRKGRDRALGLNCARARLAAKAEGRNAGPVLLETTGEEWRANPALHEEVFGPFGLVVRAKDEEEMRQIAHGMEGQLTCTLHMEEADTALAASLMPILSRKAGRLIANGFPTGVEVSDAMMHGGPYPASTNASTTSVGTLAIRRFLRPVAYQDMPAALLPEDLKG